VAEQVVSGQHAFETGGTIVAYYVRGRGPPCFVAPYAWGVNSDVIRSFFRPLESRLTFIYHDPPGTGRSGPPMGESDLGLDRVVSDLFALQSRLGIAHAAFLGHSSGSASALVYAMKYPDRVTDLVLVGAGALFPDILKSPEMSAIIDPETRERNEERFRRFVAYLLAPEIKTRKGRLAMGRAMKSSMGLNIDRAGFNFNEMRTWDVREDLGDVSVRTLILAGKHDKLTPLKWAREMRRSIPDCTLVTFERSGHFPFLDEPERFRHAVLEFLRPNQPKR